MLDWSNISPLFQPGSLNGPLQFATLQMAWNPEGLALRISVTGKSQATAAEVTPSAVKGDHFRLWLDTRPSGQIHRASEFCHAFACVPVSDRQEDQPEVINQPIAQQKIQRQESDVRRFRSLVRHDEHGYEMQLWIPGTQLNGYREIEETGRLGINAEFHDSEFGQQDLIVGGDFPNYDPSLWMQLDLQP